MMHVPAAFSKTKETWSQGNFCEDGDGAAEVFASEGSGSGSVVFRGPMVSARITDRHARTSVLNAGKLFPAVCGAWHLLNLQRKNSRLTHAVGRPSHSQADFDQLMAASMQKCGTSDDCQADRRQ
jgi:hypothetical protein